MQPPPAQKLAEMPLSELQSTVRRAGRFMNNLMSDHPRPARIRTLFVDPGARILLIPGKNLTVTHTSGRVILWDLLISLPSTVWPT
jgi:hypothetical protein